MQAQTTQVKIYVNIRPESFSQSNVHKIETSGGVRFVGQVVQSQPPRSDEVYKGGSVVAPWEDCEGFCVR